MANYDSIFGEISTARELRQRIMADPNLSDAGKLRQIDAQVAPRIAGAQMDAQNLYGRLEKQLATAEEAYRTQLAAQNAARDVGRRAYSRSRITDILRDGQWEDLQQRIEAALDSGDSDFLSELDDLWPSVDRKFPYNAGGAASDPSRGVGAYRVKVGQAVAALQPPEVKAAEDARRTAGEALEVFRAKLGSSNLEARLKNEAEPFRDILNPPARTVEIGSPGEPGWAFTSEGGRGAFGG